MSGFYRPSAPTPPDENNGPSDPRITLLNSPLSGQAVDQSPSSDDSDVCLVAGADLYTHQEVDEEDEDSSSKASADRPVSAVDVRMKNRLSGSFAESGSTSSSLQEFERLENEILRSSSHTATPQKTPQKTSSSTNLPSDSQLSVDPHTTSLSEKGASCDPEPQTSLSEIEEGHESQASDSCETVTGKSQESEADSEISQILLSESVLTKSNIRLEEEITTSDSKSSESEKRTRSQSRECHRVYEKSVGDSTSVQTFREDESEEDFSTGQESHVAISHCMLASANSLDLMSASFRSEVTMISSTEEIEYVTSEPRVVDAGSNTSASREQDTSPVRRSDTTSASTTDQSHTVDVDPSSSVSKGSRHVGEK